MRPSCGASHDATFASGERPVTGVRAAAEASWPTPAVPPNTPTPAPRPWRRDSRRPRGELAAVDAEFATIEPERAEVDELERAAGALRADIDAESGTVPELTEEARAVRAAEEGRGTRRRRVAPGHRRCVALAARAETLALALDGTPSSAEVSLAGMIGRLADHIEIEAGAEVAVASALGDALHAVVVDGDAVRHTTPSPS